MHRHALVQSTASHLLIISVTATHIHSLGDSLGTHSKSGTYDSLASLLTFPFLLLLCCFQCNESVFFLSRPKRIENKSGKQKKTLIIFHYCFISQFPERLSDWRSERKSEIKQKCGIKIKGFLLLLFRCQFVDSHFWRHCLETLIDIQISDWLLAGFGWEP